MHRSIDDRRTSRRTYPARRALPGSSPFLLSRRALLWLVPMFITIHNLEERAAIPALLQQPPALPGWVSGLLPAGIFPPSERQFLAALLVVTVLPYLFVLLGRGRERGPATLLLSLMQAVMLINVFSHLGSALLITGHAPGLSTALALNLPFSLYFFTCGLAQRWLFWRDLAWIFPFAILVHGPGLFLLLALLRGV